MTPLRRVVIPAEIRAVLGGFPPEPKRRIRAALRQLEADPQGGKPLELNLTSYWTYPVNRYRIVYRIEEPLVHVTAIGLRPVVYEQLAATLPPLAAERRAARWGRRPRPAVTAAPARRGPRRRPPRRRPASPARP